MSSAQNRLTVNLTQQGSQALTRLVERTGLNMTDNVNRALQMMDYMEGRKAQGHKVTFTDPDGNVEAMTFF